MHLFLGTNVNRLTFMELCVLCNPVLISEQGKVEIKKARVCTSKVGVLISEQIIILVQMELEATGN